MKDRIDLQPGASQFFPGFFLCLLLAIHMPVLAQPGQHPDTDLMEQIRLRAQQGGMDAQTMAELLAPAESLAEQGLPYRAVAQKTLEGLSKNVPVPQIRTVVARLQEHIVTASDIVNRWTSSPGAGTMLSEGTGDDLPANQRNQLIESIAATSSMGVSVSAVESFLARLPREARRTPAISEIAGAVRTMPDLPTAASDEDATARLLIEALNAEFSPADLRQLPAALKAAQHQTQLPATALARGVTAQMTAGTPASLIIGNLFQGNVPSGSPGGPPPGTPGPPEGTGPPEGLPNQ